VSISDIVCTANQLDCADGDTSFEWDLTGTVQTDTDCGSGRTGS
jgi:hypothetical protein